MRGWLLASTDGQKAGLLPANYVRILGKRRGTPPPPAAGHSPAPASTNPAQLGPAHIQAAANQQPGLKNVPSAAAASYEMPYGNSLSGLDELAGSLGDFEAGLEPVGANVQPVGVAQEPTLGGVASRPEFGALPETYDSSWHARDLNSEGERRDTVTVRINDASNS